jgi:hypothetical protein
MEKVSRKLRRWIGKRESYIGGVKKEGGMGGRDRGWQRKGYNIGRGGGK